MALVGAVLIICLLVLWEQDSINNSPSSTLVALCGSLLNTWRYYPGQPFSPTWEPNREEKENGKKKKISFSGLSVFAWRGREGWVGELGGFCLYDIALWLHAGKLLSYSGMDLEID